MTPEKRWGVTTQIWQVLLIGWIKFPTRRDQSDALPRSGWWRVINVEFLRSFLRRHLAGKPVAASPNVGCCLRLLLHNFFRKNFVTKTLCWQVTFILTITRTFKFFNLPIWGRSESLQAWAFLTLYFLPPWWRVFIRYSQLQKNNESRSQWNYQMFALTYIIKPIDSIKQKRDLDHFKIQILIVMKIIVFSNCCGATVGSEQQHNQDLREIYKGRRILKFIIFTTMHYI